MYKSLILEYKNQLQKLETKSNDEINELNLNIIIDKDNIINKILDEIFSTKKVINLSNLKTAIGIEPLIDLIELYINENDIKYTENTKDYENLDIEEYTKVYKNDYLKTVMQFSKPIYSFEEEQKVFKELNKNNVKQINEIMSHNYGLVLKIASKYSNDFFTKEDFFNIGILGLRTAILKFDYKKGIKFSTYATHWIKQAITRELYSKKATIRLPINYQENLAIYTKCYNELVEQLHRCPTNQEIANKTGFSLKQIDNFSKSPKTQFSLEMPVADQDGAELKDFIKDETNIGVEENIDQITESEYVRKIISEVITRPREITMLEMRYGMGKYKHPKTLGEIGKEFNLTRERVRVIIHSCENKIKREIQYRNRLIESGIDETQKTKKNNTY